jgi:tRNA1(Val) A37 N6-methylase TrmN6
MSSGSTEITQDAEPSSKVGENLAPFNPSSDAVISTALNMLQLKATDTVYDLGCGDGRFLVQAAICAGARGVGVEYDKVFADRAETRVLQAGLSNLITIHHDNALNIDLAAATAAFVYLVPKGMAQLRPELEALLLRGCRVVTYSEYFNSILASIRMHC